MIRQNAELTPFGIDEEKLKEDKAMLVKVVAAIGVKTAYKYSVLHKNDKFCHTSLIPFNLLAL